MEQTVWGDLLFFVNFCMDFQCLFLTAKLLHRQFSLWRAALFSALGAVYAVAALFFSTSGVVAFLLDCCVCFFMCMGVFLQRKAHVHIVFLPFLCYFLVSFAMGGVMSGVASLLSHIELPYGEFDGEVSSGAFFLLAALGGVLTFLWGRFSRRKAGNMHAMLRIVIAEKTLTVRGLVDTANLLCDPVSARPVVILALEVIDDLLPPEAAEVVCAGDSAGLLTLTSDWVRRMRILPTATVTGKKMMIGVLPDRVYLDTGEGEVSVDVLLTFASVCVGIEECRALLPAEIII